jgi:hypothetical protein
MKTVNYIQLAPIQLKAGIDEAQLLRTSDAFQENFVSKQPGILKRILVKAKHGGYADLVFFENKAAAEQVAQAEATSEHCQTYFDILQPPDPHLPDMGVLSFEPLKSYE